MALFLLLSLNIFIIIDYTFVRSFVLQASGSFEMLAPADFIADAAPFFRDRYLGLERRLVYMS